jgi:hypothetical protein
MLQSAVTDTLRPRPMLDQTECFSMKSSCQGRFRTQNKPLITLLNMPPKDIVCISAVKIYRF